MLKSVYEKQSKPTSAVGNKQLAKMYLPRISVSKYFKDFHSNNQYISSIQLIIMRDKSKLN